MSSPVEQFQEISKAATAHLAITFNAPDVVPFGQAALKLISAYPEERPAFALAFLRGIDTPDACDEWFIQFCVHALRWPELKAQFESMSRDAVVSNDWNRIQRLGHVLDAFEDSWEEAGVFYAAHFSQP
ncbi:hypothetical protein [Pseudoxanthomonas suwonensis]|uniref:hypothetical protein n=1 Tax=Pseudoxanthomonas suwonensis TaxID=314722 RepID=UPI0011871A85|nr:hypothetical protein [Pseudoxanthomonas suwonensis]